MSSRPRRLALPNRPPQRLARIAGCWQSPAATTSAFARKPTSRMFFGARRRPRSFWRSKQHRRHRQPVSTPPARQRWQHDQRIGSFLNLKRWVHQFGGGMTLMVITTALQVV